MVVHILCTLVSHFRVIRLLATFTHYARLAKNSGASGIHVYVCHRWSRIAAQLPGRTDNEIKNYWNTRLKKRLRSQGLDPATHLPLDSSKLEGGTGEDDDASDASDTKLEAKEAKEAKKAKKASKPSDPAKLEKPVRHPRGTKSAPQLKMCQSDDGPILVRVPNSPKPHTNIIPIPNPSPASSKCNDDDDQHSEISSNSTVTAKSCAENHHESTLACNFTSAPLCPESELWQCINPTATSTPLSSSTLLDEWDSYRHVDVSLLNPYPILPNTKSPKFVEPSPQVMLDPVAGMQHDMMHFGSQDFVAENYSGIFEGTCFAQPEMAMSWSMDVEIGQPAPECLFAPTPMALNPAGFYTREMQQPASHQELQAQELQRLAALLDLI